MVCPFFFGCYLMDVCKLDDAAAVAVVFLFDDALQGNAAEVVVDGFV